MDIDGLELPDLCMPACPWLQESWEAAGLRVDVPDACVDADGAAAAAPPSGGC